MQPPGPHMRTQRAAVPPRTLIVVRPSFAQDKDFVPFFCYEQVARLLLLREGFQIIEQGSEVAFAQWID